MSGKKKESIFSLRVYFIPADDAMWFGFFPS